MTETSDPVQTVSLSSTATCRAARARQGAPGQRPSRPRHGAGSNPLRVCYGTGDPRRADREHRVVQRHPPRPICLAMAFERMTQALWAAEEVHRQRARYVQRSASRLVHDPLDEHLRDTIRSSGSYCAACASWVHSPCPQAALIRPSRTRVCIHVISPARAPPS